MTKTRNPQDDLSHLREVINVNTPAKGEADLAIAQRQLLTARSPESVSVTQNATFVPNCSTAVIVGGNIPRVYRYTLFDEELIEAILRYNTSHPNQFNLTDARILSLICFYAFENQPFNLSNEDLARRCLVTNTTVQNSINKLLEHGLVSKKVTCILGTKQRFLTCNNDALQRFKSPTAS